MASGDVICPARFGCKHSERCGGAKPHYHAHCEQCPVRPDVKKHNSPLSGYAGELVILNVICVG